MLCNYDKSVDREKFKDFLKKLRQMNPFRKLAIFCDRLAVHRSKDVKDMAKKLGIIMILNASYSPNFNPIEGVIGLGKNKIKHQRWQNIQDDKWTDENEMISKAFK